MWLASDDGQQRYENAVNAALADESSFRTFKQNLDYNSIVGMSEQWQAPLFYEFIKNNNPKIFNKINLFKLNDTIGTPALWFYENNNAISPNTLRYIKTLVDLENNFGSLEGFTIAELGVGYGGLACVINTNSKLNDYILCNLPNVQKLAKKYLSSLNIESSVDKDKYEKFDLFISEFCLSEFDDTQIYEFYNDLILRSERIYLTMNLHDEVRKSKFLNKIREDFNIIVIDEYPKTMWPNYIIIGTKNR